MPIKTNALAAPIIVAVSGITFLSQVLLGGGLFVSSEDINNQEKVIEVKSLEVDQNIKISLEISEAREEIKKIQEAEEKAEQDRLKKETEEKARLEAEEAQKAAQAEKEEAEKARQASIQTQSLEQSTNTQPAAVSNNASVATQQAPTQAVANNTPAPQTQSPAVSTPAPQPAPAPVVNPTGPANTISFPEYSVPATGIAYSSMADFFATTSSGGIDYSTPIDTDSPGTRVQNLMRTGILHLAFTPAPGSFGNSYIIGHSSSPYGQGSSYIDSIFANLMYKGSTGDLFYHFDSQGNRHTYRVFEARAISVNDTSTAYQNYPGQKVITIQTCTEDVNTRWIIRGEKVE